MPIVLFFRSLGGLLCVSQLRDTHLGVESCQPRSLSVQIPLDCRDFAVLDQNGARTLEGMKIEAMCSACGMSSEERSGKITKG